MFNDAQHRIPSLVIGMYECKGARRANTSSRPHCFELMLKRGFMQLAAPDEYVASDWLQALVQAASGVSALYSNFTRPRLLRGIFIRYAALRNARTSQSARLYTGAYLQSFDYVARRFYCSFATRQLGGCCSGNFAAKDSARSIAAEIEHDSRCRYDVQ